jgi:SNF2 family DNA or RNA helicase
MKENIIEQTLKGKRKTPVRKHHVWVDGRWIMYAPSHGVGSVAHEVKEWGGRWEKNHQAFRLPRLTRFVRKISEFDPDATMVRDLKYLIVDPWEQRDWECFQALDPTDPYTHLYPFQQEAVHALTTRSFHGVMPVLSPGLGKTPTSIVAADIFMAEHGESQRALVVAPLALLKNWVREITGTQLRNPFQWSTDPRIEVCHQVPPTEDRSVRWTVANYDTVLERAKDQTSGRTLVTGNLNEAWDLEWDVVIFDESVLLKNRKAKRTQACRTLARAAKRVWLLSGAPTTRDNSDLWAQMNLMEPDYFTSFWRYAEESCVVVKTQWSQGEIMGSRRDFNTREEYPDLLFVRNQEEVFDDLPEYIFKDVEIELHPKQAKAHQDVLDVWVHELEENRDKRVEVTAVIAMLTRLQQITSNLYNLETTGTSWPDYSAKADFVEQLLDLGDVEWPVLIWCHHRPGAHALRDRLVKLTKKRNNDSAMRGRRVELVLGGTKGADDIIEDFKAGKIDVLILGITVGKYGHTLSNAHTIVTYDKTWDSDAWFQMLHRAAGARAKLAGHRHRPLLINPRCRGTVDDYVELNLAGKLPGMARMTGADLAKILRSLGEEHVYGQ